MSKIHGFEKAANELSLEVIALRLSLKRIAIIERDERSDPMLALDKIRDIAKEALEE